MTRVKMVRDVLDKKDRLADDIREMTAASNTVLFNMMGTPGAGKISLLEALIPELREDYEIGVIE